MTYADILPDHIKEAFRKGDAYYVSPFKKPATRSILCTVSAKSDVVYVSTTYARIFEAKRDRVISQQWN